MYIPTQPEYQESATYGPLPNLFCGMSAPDDAGDFLKAPLGSFYVQQVDTQQAKLYFKGSAAGSASDWTQVMGVAQPNVVQSPSKATGDTATAKEPEPEKAAPLRKRY